MRKVLIWLLINVIALSLASWDVQNDFSISSNPKGDWSYGVYTSGTSFAYAYTSNNYWQCGGYIAVDKNSNSYTACVWSLCVCLMALSQAM